MTLATATLARREALLMRIGERARGDWTGTVFDGRDVRDWITTALRGDATALDELDQRLDEIDQEY